MTFFSPEMAMGVDFGKLPIGRKNRVIALTRLARLLGKFTFTSAAVEYTQTNVTLEPEIMIMCEIDAWAIAIDETDCYFISEVDAPLIKQVRGVYLFDRNRRIHVCELTPSYGLTHLYNQVILVDDNDPRREELYDEYEHCSSDDIYMHCSTIDRIIEQSDYSVVDHYGNTEVSLDDVDYDYQMESVREYFCGNRPF